MSLGFLAAPVGVDGAYGNASPRVGRYRGQPWAMRTNTFGVEIPVQYHSVRLRIRHDAGDRIRDVVAEVRRRSGIGRWVWIRCHCDTT